MTVTKTAYEAQYIPVKFLDLRPQHRIPALMEEIEKRIQKVIASGRFLLGDETERFEHEWAAFCGAKYCVCCASGTDAIRLALQALLGDDLSQRTVSVPALTAWGTLAGVMGAGYGFLITDVIGLGCENDGEVGSMLGLPRHIPQPADAQISVMLWGRRVTWGVGRGRVHILDACQGAGLINAEDVASHDAVCCSFYPTKNLGAMGDGGAVLTNDAVVARELRTLRMQGEVVRMHSERKVGHSRMDEIQAAILSAKLPRLLDWCAHRRSIAGAYREVIDGKRVRALYPNLPVDIANYNGHLAVFYVDDRDRFQAWMCNRLIETAVHYPVPLHRMRAIGMAARTRPNAEDLCDHVVSLPCYPEMTDPEVLHVRESLKAYCQGGE